MINKQVLRSRPVRRGAFALVVTGLVVVVTAGSSVADNDSADGRDPDAVPGAASDVASPELVVEAGRSGAAVPDAQARSSTSSASPSVVDNGRGGPDPAVGPNSFEVAAARTAASVEVGVDSDSGQAAVPDAAVSLASAAPSAPADEDVPGAAAAGNTAARATGSAPPEAPVDRD
jgi:hypothetical protein